MFPSRLLKVLKMSKIQTRNGKASKLILEAFLFPQYRYFQIVIWGVHRDSKCFM